MLVSIFRMLRKNISYNQILINVDIKERTTYQDIDWISIIISLVLKIKEWFQLI